MYAKSIPAMNVFSSPRHLLCTRVHDRPLASSLKHALQRCKKTSSVVVSLDSAVRDSATRWMLHLAETYGFSSETFARAVSIFDAFCTHVFVSERFSMLAAAASLLISAKIEETRPLAIDQLVQASSEQFGEIALRDTELCVLDALWTCKHVYNAQSFVSPHSITYRILQLLENVVLDHRVNATVLFFADLALCSHAIVSQHSTPVIGAAVFLCTASLQMCGFPIDMELWTSYFERVFGIDGEQLTLAKDSLWDLFQKEMHSEVSAPVSSCVMDGDRPESPVAVCEPHRNLLV
ncbi:mitochondrial possible phosphoglycerate transporter family protein [Andalucia godoyi]|uniref:Mitochondrial possible phosphoglycerate transporter family protein n=1 Tax=Andalucia godoyi TaxID=505711 RepID=A0A8K0AJ84_ANDGO|nr:mitochondrial possible phosphoglycerate transporter family protein [Andalucia godoyi]|eukprot:ANDGO_06900.mRNA.1 mitochondrial possible phosphoglycerate transporter family protein